MQGLGMIGIDFADQLVQGEIDESKMGAVYKASAALGKRMKVPVWLLAQYNRIYTGGLPRPRHVRYTSLSEALSWMILMLYMPAMSFNDEKSNKCFPIIMMRLLLCWKCGVASTKHGDLVQSNELGRRADGSTRKPDGSLSKMEMTTRTIRNI
jgi:hypothetical protein